MAPREGCWRQARVGWTWTSWSGSWMICAGPEATRRHERHLSRHGPLLPTERHVGGLVPGWGHGGRFGSAAGACAALAGPGRRHRHDAPAARPQRAGVSDCARRAGAARRAPKRADPRGTAVGGPARRPSPEAPQLSRGRRRGHAARRRTTGLGVVPAGEGVGGPGHGARAGVRRLRRPGAPRIQSGAGRVRRTGARRRSLGVPQGSRAAFSHAHGMDEDAQAGPGRRVRRACRG